MKLINWIFTVSMMLLASALGRAIASQQQGVPKQDLVFHNCDDIKTIANNGILDIGGGSMTFAAKMECGNSIVVRVDYSLHKAAARVLFNECGFRVAACERGGCYPTCARVRQPSNFPFPRKSRESVTELKGGR